LSSRSNLLAVVGWGLVGAAVCAAAALLEPNLVEEGAPLHVAQRLLQGDRLYTDVVLFFGPLPFELLAVLFRLFGEHLYVARGAIVLLQGLGTASVFALARRGDAGPLAHAAAALQASVPMLLFPFFSIYFHSTLAALFSVLAVYAAVRGVDSVRWAATAGVLIGCVALCKQSVGIVLAITLVAMVVLHARPGTRVAIGGGIVGGGLAVALVTLLGFLARGSLGAFVESMVMAPLALGDSFRMPFPEVWPPGDIGLIARKNWIYYAPQAFVLAGGQLHAKQTSLIELVAQGLYALPFVTVAATALQAARRRLTRSAALQLGAVLASIAGLFPRTDWGHLSMALPAASIQLLLLANGHASAIGWRKRGRGVLAALLTLGLTAAAISSALLLYGLATQPPWDARVPVRPVTDNNLLSVVPRVVKYLKEKTTPGEPIFVARQEPLLYFITGTRNPSRYEGLLHYQQDREASEIVSALPSVRYVVMSEVDQAGMGNYVKELPAVVKHLERHFRIPPDFPLDGSQWLVVYERGPDRGETAIDLVDAAVDARYWVAPGPNYQLPFDRSKMPRPGVKHLRRPVAVMLGQFGGGIDFDIDVPPGAQFQSDTGLELFGPSEDGPARWGGSTYSVKVLHDGQEEVVAKRWVAPDLLGQRSWEPFEADLSPWAGKRVTLRLQVEGDPGLPGLPLVWWGSPRIAVPSKTLEQNTPSDPVPPVSSGSARRTP
jgi:hypothetical protein